MPRAPFNVLVIPFRQVPGAFQFAVFQRSDGSMWQFIAGGGEDGETPAEAACRECSEEAAIPSHLRLMPLDSIASVPRDVFAGGAHWPESIFVVPEYAFAIYVADTELFLSAEHSRFEWLDYETARIRLTWDSNRTALWELNERLNLASARLHTSR